MRDTRNLNFFPYAAGDPDNFYGSIVEITGNAGISAIHASDLYQTGDSVYIEMAACVFVLLRAFACLKSICVHFIPK